MYVLVDCNNFYVSCERVFNPKLQNQPVVVLSNNDGCIVARSNEAKLLGIDMAQPYFKIAHILKKHNVHVLSSNYSLYGDLSSRVMSIIAQYSDQIEVYSIDEAFINLPNWSGKELYELGLEIKDKILKDTGIPVSIGIAPTKTLCKIANELVKIDNKRSVTPNPVVIQSEAKNPVIERPGNQNLKTQEKPFYNGVLVLGNNRTQSQIDSFLKQLDIGDVWGIGRKYSKKLKAFGLQTALDLKNCNQNWILKQTNSLGLQTVLELNGQICFELETNPEPKKSIVSSRSFGEAITELKGLQQAVSSHASSIAFKLRQQNSLTRVVSVFLLTNRFDQANYYFGSENAVLENPTNYTPDLVQAANLVLSKIFKPGLKYKKCGVYVYDLINLNQDQSDQNLFAEFEFEGNKSSVKIHKSKKQKTQIMNSFDKINKHFGKNTIQIAAVGYNKKWLMKANLRSQRYTTVWGEILKVSC